LYQCQAVLRKYNNHPMPIGTQQAIDFVSNVKIAFFALWALINQRGLFVLPYKNDWQNCTT
jgi:hypothetical protein